MSDDSTAVFPVLAVRKVLDTRTVLSLRLYVRFLLCNAAAAAGMYMTCSDGTRPKRQYVAYAVMLLLLIIADQGNRCPAVP